MTDTYTRPDPAELGDYYVRHVAAMTKEDLHFKSDIAAELGLRDKMIDALQEENHKAWAAWSKASKEAERIPGMEVQHKNLRHAVNHYMICHDRYGGGHGLTGRAWDVMRKLLKKTNG